MGFIKRIIRASFVLPFSAGNTVNRNGDEICHDGSLAGGILLTTSVAILCEILIIGYTTKAEITKQFSFSLTVLTILCLLGSIVCFGISLYVHFQSGTVSHPLRINICNTIRLRFLLIFCFSCIIYKAIHIARHIDCLVKSLILDHGIQLLVYDFTCIIFYVLQTGFITHFAHSHFTSNLGVYYGLLLLFLTNISAICRALATSLIPTDNKYSNETTLSYNHKNTSSCYAASSMNSIIQRLDPFLQPSVCEYSLVSIIFIMKMWSKYEIWQEDAIVLHRVTNGNTIHNSDLVNHGRHNEHTPLMLNCTEGRIYGKHQTRRVASMITPVLLNLPSVILFCVRIAGVQSVELSLNIAIAVEASIELVLSVKCFYSLQVQCKPYKERKIINLDSSDYILITSVVAATSYYTIRLISNIFMVNLTKTYLLSMYRLTVYIVSGYLQTVFILQMKKYQKEKPDLSWLSIEYSCLFVSFMNLSFWAVDTFIISQSNFRNYAASQFYGQSVWDEVFIFLYPFVIFYRFNVFVFFYGLYDKLKTVETRN